MHPNPAFRSDDRALHHTLIDEIGFAMIFAQTPDGPRVAHTPVVRTGDGTLRFHLALGNALTRHLTGANAPALVNGPDSYISPRWYVSPDQVPTWNYVALELEGPVRRLDEDELVALLDDLSARQEARLEGEPWTRAKMDDALFHKMLRAITGFELAIKAWRPTIKLGQHKPPEDRASVADALDARGSTALAALTRKLAP